MNAIAITSFIISIILLVFLYMQSGKVKNIGSSIIGTKDVELFENTKRRGFEKYLHIFTWVLIVVFIGMPIIYLIII